MSDDEARLVELMIAYQGGDLGAFEQLYAALAGEMRRYFARNHRDRGLVHDLVQETFLELHRSRRTYSPPLPVRPWVFGIARHVCARTRRAMPFVHAADYVNEMPSVDALDAVSAIDTLPRSVREPWLLHHAFGFSFESVAARLGITPMAARLRSSRAMKTLRAALNVQRRRPR